METAVIQRRICLRGMMAERGPQIVYWIGAHKTGTNFLQETLKQSADHLAERGILYEGRWDFRNKYTDPLLSHKKQLAPPPTIPPGTETVVYFDENLVGMSGRAIGRESFYPRATKRLSVVSAHLELPPDTIILGVRSPDTFIRSAYGEAVSNGRLITFDRYLKEAAHGPGRIGRLHSAIRRRQGQPWVPPSRLRHLRWSELVSRLSAAFHPREIIAYRYEQLRGNEAKLLAHLFGVDPGRLQLPQQALRPSVFSHRAIEEVAKVASPGDSPPLLKVQAILKDIIDRFPTGKEWPPFDPWSKGDSAVFRRHYEDDMSRLSAMKGVRLLDLSAL